MLVRQLPVQQAKALPSGRLRQVAGGSAVEKDMLFSSIIFIAYFLPVFLTLYLTTRLRTAVLLIGSIIFYTWGEGRYVFLLAGLIVVNFVLGRILASAAGRSRLSCLVFALGIDLGILAVFKYAGFICENINHFAGAAVLPLVHLRLPLGISFFTFQLVSYLVDVYREAVYPETRPLRFATYILMFPHLIAGPIVRYSQIRSELAARSFNIDRFNLGIQYFIVGLGQKVLVANMVAAIADYAFSVKQPQLDASIAWVGILAYTLQIYFDFGGYSNMAIGLAFMLGFTFPKNFDYPYSSRSITEFWRRWHMSLSFWFRDYVYIPLGGNRGSRTMTIRNLLIVFFLTGLWHGPAWKFVVWGLLHGAFLLIERVWLRNWLNRIPSFVSWCYTMLVVMTAWVFFRAETLSYALSYVAAMFNPFSFYYLPLAARIILTPETVAAIAVGILFSFPVLPRLLDSLAVPRIARSDHFEDERFDTLYVHRQPTAALIAGLLVCCALLATTTLNPFLYFRF